MFFDILYNTHYASVTLGLDFVKSLGYIQVAESLNKTISPNQITKGMKVYDYDNAFYMNILPSDFANIVIYLNHTLGNLQKLHGNITIFSDMSKSQWSNSNVGKKQLIISDVHKDQNGNESRMIGQNGEPFLNLVAITNFTDGSAKRIINYRASMNEILRIKAWAEFGCKMLPGFSAFLHQVTPYFTKKSINILRSEYSKMMQEKYNQQYQNQNSGGGQQATFDYPQSNNNMQQNQSSSPVNNVQQEKKFGQNPPPPQNTNSTSNEKDGEFLF